MKKQTYESRLRAFENEKKKLYEQNLSGREFEQKVKELAEKYNV